MKWYTVSWTDLVTVEVPRLFDGVGWLPWWLRRPSRFVSEWQRKSVRIEAENVRDAMVHVEDPLRQTGRTSRMIAHVVKATTKETVMAFVIAFSFRDALRLMSLFVEAVGNGVKRATRNGEAWLENGSCVRFVSITEWQHGYVKYGYNYDYIFLDHHARKDLYKDRGIIKEIRE